MSESIEWRKLWAMPQTFLWWANPAVPVNENTQSVFPPDVHAVMDHGKRDVSRFPIATGVYTDNQPDFTWLKPFEEETFKQYFMPYKAVGQVKMPIISRREG